MLIAIALGLLVGLGQPSFNPWFSFAVAALGYGVFWRLYPRRFLPAFAFFTTVQLLQILWMTSIGFVGAGLLGVWLFIGLSHGLFFGGLTLLVGRLWNISIAALWALFEWARLFFLCGDSWNPIGLAWTGLLWPLQFVSLLGVIGLSFVAVLAALFFAQKRYVVWGLLCLLPIAYGVVQIAVVDQQPKQTIRIALVQTGESPLAVLQEHPTQVWNRLIEALRPISHPDMVVFPEGALPGDFRNTRIGGMTNEEILRSLAQRYNAPFVAGVEVLENREVLQAAVFVPPRGETEIYAKRLLVPLAEYIPFEWCRSLAARFGIYSSYAQGLKPVLFGGRCAPGICYEETFGHVVRENRTVKPQFLLFICNDGWYPGSLLPKAHFDHARPRAPELGLPMARCCTTGISALVDPLGRVVAQLGPGEKGVLEGDLPLWSFSTLYGYIGDLGLVLFCGFILLGNCVKLLRA